MEDREKLRLEFYNSCKNGEVQIDLGNGPEDPRDYNTFEPIVPVEPDEVAKRYVDFFRDDMDSGQQVRELSLWLPRLTPVISL